MFVLSLFVWFPVDLVARLSARCYLGVSVFRNGYIYTQDAAVQHTVHPLEELPSDRFLPWEEELRSWLSWAVRDSGQLLTKVVKHPFVKSILDVHMPDFVGIVAIEKWVEMRGSGEFEVRITEDGELEVVISRASLDPAVQHIVHSLQELPTDRFLPWEEDLRSC